jgi:hypothetical protein
VPSFDTVRASYAVVAVSAVCDRKQSAPYPLTGSDHRGGRFRHWIKVKNRSRVQQDSGSVLKQRGHWRMRRFEVTEDNGFIAECVRLLGLRIRHQRQLADRVPAGTHRGDGDQARSRASQTMEDISNASWDDAEEKDKP